jgi:ribosomal protein L40E
LETTSHRLARSPDALETWSCSECGARNRKSAEWCGQCYSRPPGVGDDRPPEAPAGSGTEDELEAPPAAQSAPGPEAPAAPAESAAGVDAPAAPAESAAGPDALAASPGPAPASLEEALLLFARNRSARSQAPTKEPAAGAAAVGPPAVAPASPPVQKGAFTVANDGITWSCRRCDAVNDLAQSNCNVCGTPFADVLREPGPMRPERDPGTTALLSLLCPGVGHAYLGLWGQAIARAVVSVWVGLVVLFAALQGGPGALPTILAFGAVAFCLWGVAAHDAYREARGEGDATALKSKHFLFLVLGLLGLQVGLMVLTAFGAR